MNERQHHPIDDYLSEDWITKWADDVLGEIEAYLAKHAAFADFADGNSPTP